MSKHNNPPDDGFFQFSLFFILFIFAVAMLLANCAGAPVRASEPKAETSAADLPAVLVGRDGESSDHMYARLLARFCVSNETEHLVAQVMDRLDACSNDGQSFCEQKVCAKLREDAPARCEDSLAQLP